jgi:hypothetical protein
MSHQLLRSFRQPGDRPLTEKHLREIVGAAMKAAEAVAFAREAGVSWEALLGLLAEFGPKAGAVLELIQGGMQIAQEAAARAVREVVATPRKDRPEAAPTFGYEEESAGKASDFPAPSHPGY